MQILHSPRHIPVDNLVGDKLVKGFRFAWRAENQKWKAQLIMSRFSVVLVEENPKVLERLREVYPRCYSINPLVHLVEGDCLAEDVAKAAGIIKGDDHIEGAYGVVFRLNGIYAGYAPRAIWDWLTKNE